MAGAREPGDGAPPTIVIVGLGPAGPEHLTPAARAAFSAERHRYLRTARHPAAAALAKGAISLDHHYLEAASFEQAYAGIVAELVVAARAHGRIAYGVPGSPLVLESTVAELVADSRVACELVAGMSFLDLCWERLRIDPVTAGVRLVDGQDFPIAAARDTGPLLVTQLWNKALLSAMKLALEADAGTPVVLLHHLGLGDEAVVETTWDELDRVLEPDHLTCAYLPGLGAPVGAELARLEAVVERLRLECPWDRVQTHRSLVRHLLEESYEVIEAIDELARSGEADAEAGEHLEEELGDVLCQVFFHAVLGREEGLFDLRGVAGGIADKLVRRHPHVFAAARAEDAEAVLAGWEAQKRAEKGRTSLMDGIPERLPALLYATKLERKAESAGLGASAVRLSPGALAELCAEVAAGETARAGELLFVLARRIAEAGGDPEDALRREAARFRRAFAAAERAAPGGRLEALDEPGRLAALRSALAAEAL